MTADVLMRFSLTVVVLVMYYFDTVHVNGNSDNYEDFAVTKSE